MKKGFTLIEVIIAIAIMGIAILMMTSVLTYGLNSYRNSLEQQNEQFDVRLAADTIASDAKVASHIGTFDAVGSIGPVNSSNGISYYIDGNNRMVRVENGNTKYLTDEIILNASFELVKHSTEDIYYLQFNIIGQRGYSVDTKIELLNIHSGYSSSPSVDEYCLTSNNIGSSENLVNIFFEYE